MSVTRIKAKHFKVISSSTVDICANQSGSSSGDLTLTTASGVFDHLDLVSSHCLSRDNDGP